MRKDLSRRVVYSAALAAVAFAPSALLAATETHTFNTTAEGFTIGAGGTQAVGGGAYGPDGPWYNSDNTLGASPAGEIGGRVTPTTTSSGQVYLADLTLGATGAETGFILQNQAGGIHADFEMHVGSAAAHGNGAWFVGHHVANNSAGQQLGVNIEDRSGFMYRFYPSYSGGRASDDHFEIPQSGAYRVVYDWTPPVSPATTGTLTLQVFNSDGSPRSSVGIAPNPPTTTITANPTASALNLTAWGVRGQSGPVLGGDNPPPGFVDFYLDNTTYTVGTTFEAPTWVADVSGNWGTSTNWLAGIVPNAVGAEARFDAAITAVRTVFTDSARTLGTLKFNNANTYLLTGNGSLTMQVSSGTGLINVAQGTHKINLPLTIASTTSMTIAAGAVLKISDPVTINSGAILSQGAGTGTVTYESTINVLAGGGIVFGSSSYVRSLTLNGNATASLSAGANKVLVADILASAGTTDAWTSQIDIKDNDIIVKGGGAAKVAEIINQIKQGANFASNTPAQFWKGNGIVSSLAGGGTVATGLTAVGVLYNDKQAANPAVPSSPLYTTFDGQSVGTSDVLVKYTWYGDADLSGTVNTSDYFQIDQGFLNARTGWVNGDFDYNGSVNTGDYFLIDNAFLGQGGVVLASSASSQLPGVTAVPEPASAALLGLGMLGMLARRRSNRR